MNLYRTEFFAFCPSNGVRIKYHLTIETTETIMVEQIVDEVTLHSKGYHENIADDLFRSFGGRQTLLAHHHGVDIETRRPMVPCVTCAGSGVVDRTGQGDLTACGCQQQSPLGVKTCDGGQ